MPGASTMKSSRLLSILFLVGLFALTVHGETMPAPTASPSPSASPTATPPPRTESFFQMLLRITGISATPRNQRNDNKGKPGQVWVAFLNNNTRARVLTLDSG